MALSFTFSPSLNIIHRTRVEMQVKRGRERCCCSFFHILVPDLGVRRLEWNDGSLATSNLETIASFGETLMETVCRDASSGHDITRVG